MDALNSLVFDRSPTPMWLKDYSAVKKQLEQWHEQGIDDLHQFLAQDPARPANCATLVNVKRVNHKTLELFGARDFAEFTASMDSFIICDFQHIYADLLTQLWEKGEFFVQSSMNRTLSGDYIYLQVRGYVLPDHQHDWAKVLVSTEDITLYKKALQREEEHRKLAESLFNHSPAALLMENFHPIKVMLNQLRDEGIVQLENYLDQHPEFIQRCLASLQILDANQSALDLLRAPSKSYLSLHYQQALVHDSMPNVMRYNLLQMWQGNLSTKQESCFIDFEGNTHHVYLQLTVLPNHEHDWSRVQVALTDITAMKQAEQHLKFLSEHDSLTNLYNRVHYAHEIQALEHSNNDMDLSCIFIDINGLKEMNDQYGHEAGDRLIVATANLLKMLTQNTTFTVSRIGGDEFVILMPEAPEPILQYYVSHLQSLLKYQHCSPNHPLISLSMGYTTRQHGESIQAMLNRADQLMYDNKKAHYLIHDRRQHRSA